MPRLTQQTFGIHVGIGKSAVAGLVKSGVVDLRQGMDRSRLRYIEHLREGAAGRAAEYGDLDLTAERARLARAQAIKVETENRMNDGELIPADVIEAKWTEMVAAMRAKLLALPTRIASVAMGASSLREVEDHARTEVFAALTELSTPTESPAAELDT